MEVTPSPGPTLPYLYQGGYPPNINPLTGMGVTDLSILDRRPIAAPSLSCIRSYPLRCARPIFPVSMWAN